MKKSTTLLLIMSFALLVLSGCKEKKNEPAAEVPVQSVTLSVSEYAFYSLGKTFQLEATVLPADATNPKITWKSSKTEAATVDDNGLVTSVGKGITTIMAIVGDNVATCEITVEVLFVNDICGNRYNYVKIGNQYWMSENMRCHKYDTSSGKAGSNITMYTSENPGTETYNPYCVDASEKELWEDDKYAGSLSSEQIANLGYLYNWSAAVGITATEAEALKPPFEGRRQGICPNGWHVPTNADWDALAEALGGVKNENEGYPNVGKILKTKSGWGKTDRGTDYYYFSTLPAGYAKGSVVCFLGLTTYLWSATPSDYNYKSYYCSLISDSDYLSCYHGDKDLFKRAYSVRCVKN